MSDQQNIIINCPACGQPMDVSQLPLYANAVCPSCRALTRVKTDMGPYRIIGKLGKGGMSVVYRAKDSLLGREVALKVLKGVYAGDAVRSERFEREAQIMARVSHENLVQIYAVGRDQGLFYIAMELVEGHGLDALIMAEERVPEDRVLCLAMDIVRGLDAAWNAGLMHRDIKPANVLQAPGGEAKIVDFGLSLLQSESDVEKEIWVTPYYAAPETLMRGREDLRTDMYALGATMYHMLVGAPPRVDATQSSDILLESKRKLPRLDQVVNDLSPMTCFIVDKLMSYRMEDRFSTYPELLGAVEQALAEYERTMHESGLTWAEIRAADVRRARRGKYRRTAVVSAGGVFAFGLGVWGFAVWQQRDKAPPAVPVLPATPVAGMGSTLADADAAETRLEKSIRFGRLFQEAQFAANRGDLVKAGAMFGDLSNQPACPLSTALWAGVNQVLCMWARGRFPEGVMRLEELKKKVKECKEPVELERAKDADMLVTSFISNDLKVDMPGLSANSEPAVHYYAGMALKAWYLAGKWGDYGSFRDLLANEASNGRDREIRELASAWLGNLREYSEQYEHLRRLKDMPEKTVAEVDAKKAAVDFLREQMLSGEVPSMQPAYAALETMLDHLRMQYQTARDWEAAEAVRLERLREEQQKRQKLKEAARRDALRAAQGRSYLDVSRELAEVMVQTGDYEKVSAACRKAESIVFSPVVKAKLAARREMSDRMVPLFSRMAKILPALLDKKPGLTIALNNGDKVRLTGMKGQLLLVAPQDGKAKDDVRLVSWDQVSFNSLHALAKECRQSKPAEFAPLPDTYSRPLLIFGYLTQTLSPAQQESALMKMDHSFIEQWNVWMEAMDASEDVHHKE